jgi:hypothetical protein
MVPLCEIGEIRSHLIPNLTGNRFGAHEACLGASGFHLEAITGIVPQQPLTL